MQTDKAVLKVPEGKLVRVCVEHDSKAIRKVRITGDFFVHPEEALAQVEEQLVDAKLDADEIQAKIDKFVYDNNVLLVGFCGKDVAQAILQAATGGVRKE